MDKFTTLTGVAAPLPMINVDTDAIIPKQFLKTIERTGLGKNLLYELRYDEDGKEKPDFVLNKPAYRKAQILVAGENFGCGSSREHAPWALLDFGIRCVIAPSFADIFYNNCFQNGILPIKLPQADVDKIMDDANRGSNATITIDLEKQEIRGPDGGCIKFEMDTFRKRCLLEGLDNIGLTLESEKAITDYEAKAQVVRPCGFERRLNRYGIGARMRCKSEGGRSMRSGLRAHLDPGSSPSRYWSHLQRTPPVASGGIHAAHLLKLGNRAGAHASDWPQSANPPHLGAGATGPGSQPVSRQFRRYVDRVIFPHVPGERVKASAIAADDRTTRTKDMSCRDLWPLQTWWHNPEVVSPSLRRSKPRVPPAAASASTVCGHAGSMAMIARRDASRWLLDGRMPASRSCGPRRLWRPVLGPLVPGAPSRRRYARSGELPPSLRP